MTNYVFIRSSCEICKAIYPDKISVNGRDYELFNVDRPKENDYLILSVIGLSSGKNIQVLEFPPGVTLTVGRNRDCDMQINDASISQ